MCTLSLTVAACAGTNVRPTSQAEQTPAQGSSSIAERAMAELPETATDAERPADSGRDAEPRGIGIPIENSELVRGSASVIVRAPLPRVREEVLRFGEYAEFMPHYQKSRVLGRTSSGAREVYMEIHALHGAVRMWAKVEVPKPIVDGDGERIEMRMTEGNVKNLEGVWRLRAIDAETTELTLEIFLHPNIPMPARMMNDENIRGAVRGVSAMQQRVERARTAAQ
jgi:ribosome-associated toxin RatA of RatAB toxin-antitoxin module